MTARENYNPDGYTIGDYDTRPWGKWEVTNITKEGNEEMIEKKITVNPSGILSLQSHKYRREIWTVISGTIRVTLDDQIFDLKTGETIKIPLGAKHRMANPFEQEAVIHEVQIGQCMESDIIRYEDHYGRT